MSLCSYSRQAVNREHSKSLPDLRHAKFVILGHASVVRCTNGKSETVAAEAHRGYEAAQARGAGVGARIGVILFRTVGCPGGAVHRALQAHGDLPQTVEARFPRVNNNSISAEVVLYFFLLISLPSLYHPIFLQILVEVSLIEGYVVVAVCEKRLQGLFVDVDAKFFLVLDDTLAAGLYLQLCCLHVLAQLFFL